MAEGYARKQAPSGVEIYSAGIEKHGMNRLAVKVMDEAGVPIDSHFSKTLDELSIEFDLVITLCGHADETCPAFQGEKQHWGFPDPAKAVGNEDDVLDEFRTVRDNIFHKIDQFLQDMEL